MKIKLETIQKPCSTISNAVDANSISQLTEVLELETKDDVLQLSVTNKEYFVTINIPVDDPEEIHATVDAELFTKLISRITTEYVELSVTDKFLVVKGNGTYRLPLIFEDSVMMTLPRIEVNNISSEFDVSSDVLNSIMTANSRQLDVGVISNAVQKYFYIDQHGALTFTSGATVNNFDLGADIKLLLNARLVKLFKLFENEQVHICYGTEPLSDEIIQTRISFTTPKVRLSAILSCDDTMLKSVPVTRIRSLASDELPYTVSIPRNKLLEALERFSLFSQDAMLSSACLDFEREFVKVSDTKKNSTEKVMYETANNNISEPYEVTIDIIELTKMLDSNRTKNVHISFGNNSAILLVSNNVTNVIPEIRVQ